MDGERWVSQSEAARHEGVAQSSISRFLTQNPDVPVRKTSSGRVQWVELNALSAARGGSLFVQDKQLEREARPEPVRQIAGSSTDRKRAAEAERAELDLAERKGEVVSKDAVTMALESAGVAFVQGLERRRRRLAQSLTGIADARTIELELKKADRDLLDALTLDLAKALTGQPIEDETA